MISSHVNSLFNSVSYRIGDILIDPGDEWEGFYNVSAILLTHAHFDHIYGLSRVIELNPEAKVYTNEFGKKMLLDPKLNMSKYHESPFIFNYPENLILIPDSPDSSTPLFNVHCSMFAKRPLRFFSSPGHNPSCISYIIGDSVFTGDAYIPGLKTVTNLPDGNEELAQQSIKEILKLSEGKAIFPGHKIL